MVRLAATRNNILNDFSSTLNVLKETWKSFLFVFLTYFMTYLVFPSVICFRKMPNYIAVDVKKRNLDEILRARSIFAIFVMGLFYTGIWFGFGIVMCRKNKHISILASTIITVIRLICIIIALIDSVSDKATEGTAISIFDSLTIVVLGFTHGILVYYHLA